MSDDLYDGPCEAGCISFHGGERKHHKDCGHYPHSLTKVNADRIEELEANINLKADFIDATLNQLAASDQRIEELEAKLAVAEEKARALDFMAECLVELGAYAKGQTPYKVATLGRGGDVISLRFREHTVEDT